MPGHRACKAWNLRLAITPGTARHADQTFDEFLGVHGAFAADAPQLRLHRFRVHSVVAVCRLGEPQPIK